MAAAFLALLDPPAGLPGPGPGGLHGLSISDQQALSEAWARFASPEAAALDRHGLKCAFTAVLGSRPSRQQLQLIMRSAGPDGLLGWDAFRHSMQALLQSSDPDEHIRQLFKACDVRGAGFLSRDDAHAVFHHAAPTVPPRVVDEVFDELDVDHDGRVSARDFIAMMRMGRGSSLLAGGPSGCHAAGGSSKMGLPGDPAHLHGHYPTG